MRPARFCFVFSFTVFGLSNAALGGVSVGGRISGLAGDNSLFPVTGINLTCPVTGCEGSTPGNAILTADLTLDGEASWGHANATARANAHAEAGHLGLNFVGAAVAGENKSSALFVVQSLSAGWQDEVILSTTKVAFTNNLRVQTRLFLDGDLGGSASGEGEVSANFIIVDDCDVPALPPAPYPSGEWGSFREVPRLGLHELQEIPGGIRLTNILRNGVGSSVGFTMILNGGGNTDGNLSLLNAKPGTAILFANIANSLRWGGIESVTDEFGNPIDDWTITSASGFDYSKPFGVPEPSGILLIGTVLCMNALRINRRH